MTKPNRLMLFGETVAIYCDNRMLAVTSRLAVYRQSVRLGVEPLEVYEKTFFFFFCN
jgi:hypothetical protein